MRDLREMSREERDELLGRMLEIQRAEARLERETRTQLTYWAAVMCSCRMRFDRDWPSEGSPVGCVIHGQFMVTPQGRVL